MPPGRRKPEFKTPKSYYDVPMLKPPVWKWEIATYFFLGGLSAGAYLLARTAARFGGNRYQDITQAGTAIAATAFVPCAPLLIRDLGDMTRFHYMLRVFKPRSPMNLGTWTLTGYGAMLTLTALREWRKGRRGGDKETRKQGNKETEETQSAIGNRQSAIPSSLIPGVHPEGRTHPSSLLLDAALDGAGMPLALLLAGYTGVLLSTSVTPLWARNRWLGPLFSASAISTGASALELALQAQSPNAEARPSHRPLKQIDTVAKITEAVALAGYLGEAGKFAAPITKGKYAPHFWGGAVGAGLAGSALLGAIPVKNPKARRVLRIAGAVAGLAGGFALRWAISQGGHISGSDPQAARDSSRGASKGSGS